MHFGANSENEWCLTRSRDGVSRAAHAAVKRTRSNGQRFRLWEDIRTCTSRTKVLKLYDSTEYV